VTFLYTKRAPGDQHSDRVGGREGVGGGGVWVGEEVEGWQHRGRDRGPAADRGNIPFATAGVWGCGATACHPGLESSGHGVLSEFGGV